MRLLAILLNLSLFALFARASQQSNNGDTNAQRLARGLPLRSPRKLWTRTQTGARPARYAPRAPAPAATFAAGQKYSFDVIAGKTYRLTARGGTGGASNGYNSAGQVIINAFGGRAGEVIVNIPITANRTLYTAVGSAAQPDFTGGGGGGGTFVYFAASKSIDTASGADPDTSILLAAGGGGGAYANAQGSDATVVAGDGSGGAASQTQYTGGGGAGWFGPGGMRSDGSQGGQTAPTWLGGMRKFGGQSGAFGGGGARDDFSAGGGGGYSGGRADDGNGQSGDPGYSLGGSNFVATSIPGLSGLIVSESNIVYSGTATTLDGELVVEELP